MSEPDLKEAQRLMDELFREGCEVPHKGGFPYHYGLSFTDFKLGREHHTPVATEEQVRSTGCTTLKEYQEFRKTHQLPYRLLDQGEFSRIYKNTFSGVLKNAPSPSRKKRVVVEDHNSILRDFHRGDSRRAIASRLEIDPTTVAKVLKRLGVKPNKKPTIPGGTKDKAIRDYQKDKSATISSLAEKYKVSEDTVGRWLRADGLCRSAAERLGKWAESKVSKITRRRIKRILVSGRFQSFRQIALQTNVSHKLVSSIAQKLGVESPRQK